MSGTKYPGLNRLTDPEIRAVAKILFDKIGLLESQAVQIGTVSAPLTDHLDANSQQLKAVADPTQAHDAVTLQYLQHYVESRVRTVTAAATAAPPAAPPSDGPIIPAPPVPQPNVPPTQGSISAADMLDLTTVTILSSPPDIATWARTATLSTFDFQASGVYVDFTKKTGAGRWPDVPTDTPGDSLEYTLWLFLKISGTWYGAGLIQFWYGLDRNGGPPSQMALNWTGGNKSLWAPLGSNQPAVGTSVGFMVAAGNLRNTPVVSSVKERSQTILVPFPSDGGGVWTTP